jgi:hydroxymethylpyrimidine/phosphomethylpyrimidine kinase
MVPCALAIGGLDPGGGAGILADLRAFHAQGVFGCAAVAVLTVQSTDGLTSSRSLPAKLVVEQAAEVFRVQSVRAIKIGALGSAANVRAVARWLATIRGIPVVVDPVVAPTLGHGRLLTERAAGALRDELLPRATLVTANAGEAAILTGKRVRTEAEARHAAERLVELGAGAALVKGGHLSAEQGVVDTLAWAGRVTVLRAPRMRLPPLHGGGCVLASLIAGSLAAAGSDVDLVNEVKRARRLHRAALARPLDVGGAMRVLWPLGSAARHRPD